jgi:hypothetical protein
MSCIALNAAQKWLNRKRSVLHVAKANNTLPLFVVATFKIQLEDPRT